MTHARRVLTSPKVVRQVVDFVLMSVKMQNTLTNARQRWNVILMPVTIAGSSSCAEDLVDFVKYAKIKNQSGIARNGLPTTVKCLG